MVRVVLTMRHVGACGENGVTTTTVFISAWTMEVVSEVRVRLYLLCWMVWCWWNGLPLWKRMRVVLSEVMSHSYDWRDRRGSSACPSRVSVRIFLMQSFQMIEQLDHVVEVALGGICCRDIDDTWRLRICDGVWSQLGQIDHLGSTLSCGGDTYWI